MLWRQALARPVKRTARLLGKQQEFTVNELNAKVRKYSEAIGLARADHVANSYCNQCSAKMLKANYLDRSENNQYDRIYEITHPDGKKEILKIEAKGGSAPSYGTAQVGQNRRGDTVSAQQGSKEYETHIDRKMKEKYVKYERMIDSLTTEQMEEFNRMKQTRKALQNSDKVTYIGIEQRLDSDGHLHKSSIAFFN